MTKERIKSKVYAVLTPEQRTKAQELRESWKACHGKKHMKHMKDKKDVKDTKEK